MQALISYTRQVICRDSPQDAQALCGGLPEHRCAKHLSMLEGPSPLRNAASRPPGMRLAPKITTSKNLRPHRVKHQVSQTSSLPFAAIVRPCGHTGHAGPLRMRLSPKLRRCCPVPFPTNPQWVGKSPSPLPREPLPGLVDSPAWACDSPLRTHGLAAISKWGLPTPPISCLGLQGDHLQPVSPPGKWSPFLRSASMPALGPSSAHGVLEANSGKPKDRAPAACMAEQRKAGPMQEAETYP